MRPELESVKELDDFILRKADPGQLAVTEAKLILSPRLRSAWRQQLTVHRIVRLFWKREKRKELEQVYQDLMNIPAFKEEILSIFK